MTNTMGLEAPLPTVEEPADESRTLRPTRWGDYVGQADLVTQLRTKCQAAFNLAKPLGHLLISGPLGSGKTTLAHLAAQETGESMEIIARPVNEGGLMEALWELPAERGVLFIDEAHRQSKATQESLLTLTEEGYIQSRWGTATFPWITVIMATTEKRLINEPLQSRCTILDMVPYTDDEMATIVRGMAARVGVELAEGMTEGLATAAVGVPRAARHLVLGAHELAAVGQAVTLDSVLNHCRVQRDGLTADHLAYMQCLVDVGGNAGQETLSVRLQLHRTQVQRIERLLVDRDYVKYAGGSIGRILTGKGRARLREAA
jgi:Holliday junction DNA helicase RuvB